jgi:hypothetical protein
MDKSWKVEVRTDSSGRWYGNAIRYATREEAVRAMHELELRWVAVREARVVGTEDPVLSMEGGKHAPER